MRISDWSSDVCSSDLPIGADFLGAVDADVDAEGHPRLADHHGLDLEVLAAKRAQAEQARRHHGGDDHRDDATGVEAVERHELGQPHRILVGRSEEHTSELQSLMRISYAVFCLKKKKYNNTDTKTQ